jgi:hypothetical protein
MSADDKSMPNIRVKPPALKAPVVHPPAAPIFRDIESAIPAPPQADVRAEGAAKPLPSPVAVIVFHGIGDEVRFDTLSRVVAMLVEEVGERTGQSPSIQISSVPSQSASGGLEVRSELCWDDAAAGKREVHVYECYWAPMTAGKVTYWETMSFLMSAGWRGLQYALNGSFMRWLFGDFRMLKITRATIPLLFVLLGVMGFTMAAIAMALAGVAGVAKQISNGETIWQQFNGAVAFIYGQVAHPWNGIVLVIHWILAGSHLADPAKPTFWLLDRYPSSQYWWQTVVVLLAWAVGVWVAYRLQQILTLFVGSLVAYLSPYKDSKWEDLRHVIQQQGLDVARTVYHGYEKSGWIPKYERIVILGHSLGSVIAYDTLNAMINLQAASLPAGANNPVVQRTQSLITFGSPLDKTAFLFRLQFKPKIERMQSEGYYREAMASSVQPLITDYMYRLDPGPPRSRPKWINIWSRRDVVSGALDYYDDPDVAANHPGRVENVIDPDANTWIVAHLQYWTNPLLRKRTYDELFD